MRAETAGKLIARFIDKQWPNDREDIFDILKMAINKAWQEGRWLGMTAEFFVKIQKQNGQSFFISPISHPILLAINGENLGLTIRDQYFMFHKNGHGDIKNSKGCKWNQDVYDLPPIPTFRDTPCSFRIGIRAIGPVGPNEKVFINGSFADGQSVFTYRNREDLTCSGVKIDTTKVDVISGIELAVSQGFNYINNIIFSGITKIEKTNTLSPIEVIAIDSENRSFPIARLDPNQTISKYRKYLVPEQLCGEKALHALFKIGQQEDIVGPNDSIMITNEEAIIALSMGVYNLYNKQQLELGATYVLQGITVLEKEITQEESPSEFPIQVDNLMSGNDLPRILKITQ